MRNRKGRPGLSPPEGGDASCWTSELYQMFAPVRDSLKDRADDEINQAIDEAIAGARNGGLPAANVATEE